MTENEQLVSEIVNGIQDKKGKRIAVVNLTALKEAPCGYFVICEGDSNVQVAAIATSVKDHVRDTLKVKPFAADGFENSLWIAIDYGQIIVHVFKREAREFYDIEHLWEDAEITFIPDLE